MSARIRPTALVSGIAILLAATFCLPAAGDHAVKCPVIVPAGTPSFGGPGSMAAAGEPLIGTTSTASYRLQLGWVPCVMFPPGDCNGDGRTNLADVDCLVSILLGNNLDLAQTSRIDLNRDTVVDGRDIGLFVGRILGG